MATSAFLLSRQCPRLLGASTRSLGSGALRGGFRQHGMFNRSIVTLSRLSRFDRLSSLTLSEKFNQFRVPRTKVCFVRGANASYIQTLSQKRWTTNKSSEDQAQSTKEYVISHLPGC